MNPSTSLRRYARNAAEMDQMAHNKAFSRSRSVPLRLRYALRKSDWDMPPDLNRENHRGREQKRSYRDMRHRRHHHWQFRLNRSPGPRPRVSRKL